MSHKDILLIPMCTPPTRESVFKLEHRLEKLDCFAVGYITGEGDPPFECSQRLSVIGAGKVKALVEQAMSYTKIEPSLFFGAAEWYRGYGGANNIALLVGTALRERRVIKIDDDCSLHSLGPTDFHPGTRFLLGTALSKTSFGQRRSYECAFSPRVLELICDYSHPPVPHGAFIQRQPGARWDNACYIVSAEHARIPYPVLHDDDLGICLRGEIYYREPFLTAAGVDICTSSTIVYAHSREQYDSALWAKQMLAAGDLVYTFAAVYGGADHDASPSVRHSRNAAFKRQLEKADVEGAIVSLASEMLDGSIERTQSFIERIAQAQRLWPEILHNVENGQVRERLDAFLPAGLKA